MKLGKKLENVMAKWGIHDVAELARLTPAQVLAVEGVGESTLLRLRKYLAHRGLALADDREPAYWLKLAEVPEGEPPPTETDFIVRVCCNEQYPFRFDEAKDDDGKPVAVRTEVSALWAEGLADYAIKGLEGEFALERKADDLFSSLSHGRENFENEIARLDAKCDFVAIVCENSWGQMFEDQKLGRLQHGASLNVVHRTWLSWSIRYPSVHWFFCDGRVHAEMVAWGLIRRFWSHYVHRKAKGQLAARQAFLDPLADLDL
jgi:hypothetical protein